MTQKYTKKETNNYIREGGGFGVMLLALIEIVGAFHLNGETQIAETARQVGFDQHVARVHVAMSHRQLFFICKLIFISKFIKNP